MEDEKRMAMLGKYQEYHLSNGVSITEKSLEEAGRVFLSSVKPEDRYIYLTLHCILAKTAQNFERNENSIHKMKTGFNCLEKYAINLWKFPWRKEYHTIKLYTAFFKGNIQQKLQDKDAILTILNSLGYTKTEQDSDRLSLKEPDTALAIRVSLELFLVQLDLQVIKEIMENVPESKLTLKDIVKARGRTSDVKDACKYLSSKLAKRQKLDTPNEGDPTSNIKVAFTNHSTNTASNDYQVASGTEGKAVNASHSSAGFSVTSKVASVPSDHSTTHRYVLSNINDFGEFSDHDLYGVDTAGHEARQHRFDTRYSHSAQSYAHFAEGDILGLDVYTQSHAAHSVTRVSSNGRHQQRVPLSEKHIYQQDMSRSSTASQQFQAREFTDKRTYQQDTTSPASQRYQASEFTELSHRREVTTGANDSSAVMSQGRSSVPEPMDVDQMEHNRLQNKLSYSKATTERLRNRRKTDSGVSNLKDTLQYNLTLENGSSREPSNTREAPSSQVGTTRVVHIGGREVTGITQPSRPAVEGLAEYGTSTRTPDGRVYSLHKTEQNSLSVEHPRKGTQSAEGQNAKETGNSSRTSTRSATEQLNHDEKNSGQTLEKDRSSEGPSKDADYESMVSSSKKNRRAEGTRSDAAFEATASSSNKDRHSAGATGSTLKKDNSSEGARSYTARSSLCNHCMQQGQLICKNCLVIICKACQQIFETNLCDSTKGQHVFMELADKKIVGVVTMSNQERTSNRDDEREWSCNRCTYLNSPEHVICVMCGATRGVDAVEQSKPGSTVCRNCTLHNDEGTKVCAACHKTLDRSETFV